MIMRTNNSALCMYAAVMVLHGTVPISNLETITDILQYKVHIL